MEEEDAKAGGLMIAMHFLQKPKIHRDQCIVVFVSWSRHFGVNHLLVFFGIFLHLSEWFLSLLFWFFCPAAAATATCAVAKASQSDLLGFVSVMIILMVDFLLRERWSNPKHRTRTTLWMGIMSHEEKEEERKRSPLHNSTLSNVCSSSFSKKLPIVSFFCFWIDWHPYPFCSSSFRVLSLGLWIYENGIELQLNFKCKGSCWWFANSSRVSSSSSSVSPPVWTRWWCCDFIAPRRRRSELLVGY